MKPKPITVPVDLRPLLPAPLKCAPCLAFGAPDDAEDYDGPDAATVKDGTALCHWHFEYGLSFQSISRWDHRQQ